MNNDPILLMITPFDEPYLSTVKPLLKGRHVKVISANPDSAGEIEIYAKSQGCNKIITTNPVILNQVVDASEKQSLDNWAGSIWERNGITFLFINPLKQLYSVPYGRFIAERFLSKIVSPEKWWRTPKFSFSVVDASNVGEWYDRFRSAVLIAGDIETTSWDQFPNNPLQGERRTIIRSISYAGLFIDKETGLWQIATIVLPIGDAPSNELGFWVAWMRKFNLLEVPKVFQNGLYDSWHLCCYGAPVKAYLFDTQSLFHSWYCELPKDLAFITAFTVHNIFYWKDMAHGTSLQTQWEYNARDSWATLLSLLGILQEAPNYVDQNHLIKFPLWVPALVCNLEGVKVNETTRQNLVNRNKADVISTDARLRRWFGEGFNPRSPQQVTKLIAFYGSPDITGSSEAELRSFALRHPINARFVGEILRSREIGKLISTYLKPHDFSLSINKSNKKRAPLTFHGRVIYGLNPDGTDNGRLACKEGASWTGMQIQNQPTEEDSVKSMLVADSGEWRLFEIDNERSETYCTAYKSGDANLLETIRQDREEGKDFHIVNATRFFGLRYEDVTKDLRDKVSKRVNHGANYNMGPAVLLQTMGEKNVDLAKRLLNLPSHYTRIQVCTYLLDRFDKGYPDIRGAFYDWVKTCVMVSHVLVSDIGWTRYCFGNPAKSKPDLNAYVAHVPSNLSVGIVNNGFKKVFWEVQYKNSKDFRLKAQIHDSVFGQVRVGKEQLVREAAKLMVQYVPVTDCKGVKRVMSIPVAMKISAPGGDWGHMEKFK